MEIDKDPAIVMASGWNEYVLDVTLLGAGLAPKVAYYEERDFFVSTISGVVDSEHSCETAVCHKKYYGGKWIVAEEYDTPEDAKIGHEKWVGVMKIPPDELADVSTSGFYKDRDAGGTAWRVHRKSHSRDVAGNE